jgi:gas vesicle protein
MENRQESEHDEKESNGFLTGLLLGGLVGAGVMLLLAPQSGKRTWHQIQEKGMELREQAVKTVEDTAAQVRTKANETTTNLQKHAAE